jgi:hypothetical protein
MKKKMTTAEFIEKTEADIRRQEIRELCEEDPGKKNAIRRKKNALIKLVDALKDLTGRNREDRIEYR